MRKTQLLISTALFLSLTSCGVGTSSTSSSSLSNGSSASSSSSLASSDSSTQSSSSNDSSSDSGSSASSSLDNDFVVTFKNYDATILFVDTVSKGERAIYQGDTPSRPSSERYSYSFSGWSKSLDNVQSSFDTYAQYTQNTNSYTVTFKNDDGTVLWTDTVDYGANATYGGETPTKPKTAQYTYSFSGWDVSLNSIKKDTVVVAQYSKEINKYTVTFKNYDGTVLWSTSVNYDSSVVYGGTTPTKPKTAQYTYSFSGWDVSLSSIKENTTATAKFTENLNTYTVTFKNANETVIWTDTVEYGGSATYGGDTPTEELPTADYYYPLYEYSFSGWDKSLDNITSNTVITAEFVLVKKEAYKDFDLSYINEIWVATKYTGTSTAIVVPDGIEGLKSAVITDETVSLSIPASVTTIINEGWAYEGRDNVTNPFRGDALQSITVSEDNSCYSSNQGVLFNKDRTSLICYPRSKTDTTYTTPKSTTTIFDYAFYRNNCLTSISLNDSVQNVGNQAFGQNYRVLLTVSGTSAIKTIGIGAFNCWALKDFTFSDCLETIGAEAFYDSKITSVTIAKTVKSIGSIAFGGCGNLASIVVDSANENYVSEYDSALLDIGKTTLIAFPMKSTLTSYVVPSTVTSLQGEAMAYCSEIKTITLPSGLKTLEADSLRGIGASSVTLPSGLETIGARAFWQSAITSMSIPSSVVSIGTQPFVGCDKLVSINVDESNANYCAVDNVLYNKAKTELIHYCQPKTSASFTVPDTVETVADSAFYSNSSITKVILSASLKYLSWNAFVYCSNLETVEYSGTTAQWGKVTVVANAFSGTKVTTIVCNNGTVTL